MSTQEKTKLPSPSHSPHRTLPTLSLSPNQESNPSYGRQAVGVRTATWWQSEAGRARAVCSLAAQVQVAGGVGLGDCGLLHGRVRRCDEIEGDAA